MSNVYTANAATIAEEASKIIPRAEFRVFGQGVLDIVKKSIWTAHAKLFKVRESAETYFLSRLTNEANVKVRDSLLDIKTKVGETEDGKPEVLVALTFVSDIDAYQLMSW